MHESTQVNPSDCGTPHPRATSGRRTIEQPRSTQRTASSLAILDSVARQPALRSTSVRKNGRRCRVGMSLADGDREDAAMASSLLERVALQIGEGMAFLGRYRFASRLAGLLIVYDPV